MNYFSIDTFEKLKVALDNDFWSVELKLIGPDHIYVDALSNGARFKDYRRYLLNLRKGCF